MKTDRKLKQLYAAAYQFLESEIGRQALENKLNHYRQYKAETMEDVYWHLINSLTNKVGMRATIGDIDALTPHLFHWDPWQTCDHYRDDWEKLFRVIQADYTPLGPMNIKNKSSFWVIFCKGILSGAAFLSEFESVDHFDEFVQSFAFNDLTIAALPIVIDQEVYGMGFPLGCDWLKEIGYGNYGKPDTHTIDILSETGLAPGTGTYDVFKTLVRLAKANGEQTVIVDYVLWLVGSGRYVGENDKITRQGLFNTARKYLVW
jgi:hypothetical protein